MLCSQGLDLHAICLVKRMKVGEVIGESMVVVVYGVVAGRCVFVTDAKCELAKNTDVYVACGGVGKCAKAGNANMMTGR